MTRRAVTIGLVLLVAAVAALVSFQLAGPEAAPPPPERAPAPPTASPDADLAGLLATRLVDGLVERSGIRVSAEEGRCLAEGALESLGADGLREMAAGRGGTLDPATETALLRSVIGCLDAERAAELLEIPAQDGSDVPLPGDVEG